MVVEVDMNTAPGIPIATSTGSRGPKRPRGPMLGAVGDYFRIWLLLVASLVVIAVMSALLSRSLKTLNNGTAWVVHTERVRFQLAQIQGSMNDLGAGVAGYELTHDPSRFEPALAAATAIPDQLTALQQLVASDPAEQPLVARLIDLAHQREMQSQDQRNLALRGDVARVQQEVWSGDAKRLMDATRQVIAQLQQAESALLALHGEATERARRTVAFGVEAAAVLAMLLLITVAVVTVRQAELQRALQERLATRLREADQRKDVFLATLSHELRNPLAPIRGAARVLETPGAAPAQIERSRQIIARQVRQLASLLDDLLDVSRITRGVLALKHEVVDLGGILEAALETAQPAIAAKRQHLRTELPDAPITLEADPVRITQIVANLLTNASKYTPPEGTIILRAARGAEGVLIKVRDTGIGIAQDSLHKVFDMFSQIDSSNDASGNGLGIGLALVKGFVELHGGRVEAHSDGPGCGSEFIVTLPLSMLRSAVAPVATIDPASQARPTGRIVLVADDNHDGAEVLAMLLLQSGYGVHVAHSGAEALSIAERQRPDVAVLDIGMPGMTGYEVAQRIRAEAWGARIQLIAVTGWGHADDKRKAGEAGFDHHLTKPVDPDHLERLMTDRAVAARS
jgi:signal transduction histidine kinase/CheY-like chemotaxis protein